MLRHCIAFNRLASTDERVGGAWAGRVEGICGAVAAPVITRTGTAPSARTRAEAASLVRIALRCMNTLPRKCHDTYDRYIRPPTVAAVSPRGQWTLIWIRTGP